jgi:cytochrome c556
MSLPRLVLGAATLAAGLGLGAAAANPMLEAAINARKAQMQLYAFNVGVLAGMVQGNRPYEAADAQAAADNLVALASLSKTIQWPAGSDNGAMAGTRALPSIWANPDDFAAKYAALSAGAEAMAAVAGNGLDAVRGAIGGIGGACSACHQAYRAP